MPTERFYNLPEGKKKMIREAAMGEFVRVPFEKASINKIIQAAGISRGSFYTYFQDKFDVLGYIFEDATENLKQGWLKCAGKNGGNLWKTSEAFLDYSISYTKENVLVLMKNLADSERVFGEVHKMRHDCDPKLVTLLEVMYHSVDKTDFRNQGIETFGKLVAMIFLELAHCMGWYYHHQEDTEKVKKVFHEKLEILQYGICKK